MPTTPDTSPTKAPPAIARGAFSRRQHRHPQRPTRRHLQRRATPVSAQPRPQSQEYGLANEVDHPRNVYLREDALTDPLDTWLATAFTPDRLQQTITAMADAHQPDQPSPLAAAARATIAACEPKLAQYRAALDAGADPTVVTSGIGQTLAETAKAEADLRITQTSCRRRMTETEIANLVQALGDIVTMLHDADPADPADKAEVYRQLGLRLTYRPDTQTVRAEADLGAHRGVMVRVRGDLKPPPPRVCAP